MTKSLPPLHPSDPENELVCSGDRFAVLFAALARSGLSVAHGLLEELPKKQRQRAKRAVLNSPRSAPVGRYVIVEQLVENEWLREQGQFLGLVIGQRQVDGGDVPDVLLPLPVLARALDRLIESEALHLADVPQDLINRWVAALPRDRVLELLDAGWDAQPAKLRFIVATTSRSDRDQLPLEEDPLQDPS